MHFVQPLSYPLEAICSIFFLYFSDSFFFFLSLFSAVWGVDEYCRERQTYYKERGLKGRLEVYPEEDDVSLKRDHQRLGFISSQNLVITTEFSKTLIIIVETDNTILNSINQLVCIISDDYYKVNHNSKILVALLA